MILRVLSRVKRGTSNITQVIKRNHPRNRGILHSVQE